MNPDPTVHEPAVHAWSAYEGTIACLVPNPTVQATFGDPAFALGYARMNMHYFTNNCFLDDRPILDRVDRLTMPGILIHGRYDLATAYRSSFELAQVWPQAELITVPDAGHSRLDPPMGLAMIEGAERIKKYWP